MNYLSIYQSKSFVMLLIMQGLIDAHAQFKATLGEADKEFSAIISLIHGQYIFRNQFVRPSDIKVST